MRSGEGSFRQEARLDSGTPHGATVNPVAPAGLPTSSKASQSSADDSSEEITSTGSPPASSQVLLAKQMISDVTAISLPGSLAEETAGRSFGAGGSGGSSADDLGRWGGGELAAGRSGRHQTHDLAPALPESSDYEFEKAEIERLSQSPEFIAEKNKDPDFTMLHFVAMLGHRTLAEALPAEMISRHHAFSRLARCLLTHFNAEVFVKDKYGCTPLQLAAACGNAEMVRALLQPYAFEASGREVLDQKFDGYGYLNHQDSQINFSALHGAVNHDAYDAVILLLKFGANPQALDVTRKTAFEVAPTLASLQELLRLAVQRQDEVPRSVIVQLMAIVLDKQLKEGGPQQPQSQQQRKQQDGSGAASASLSGGGGGSGSFQQDDKASRSLVAQQRWSKATRFATSATQAPQEPAQRFTGAVLETIGNIHNADVCSTIKRHFGMLYKLKRYDVLVEYVILAINANQYKLTEMMIDRICCDCPDVLAAPNWHETLEPLVSTYPTLFHHLLAKLQDMRDEDVRGFVRCLSPARLQAGADKRPHTAMVLMTGQSQRGGGLGGGGRAHAVDRVKLLIYQQLVEGLKKVSYRIVKTFFEQSDQRLLNDMAQFPIFAEFVGLVAKMQTAKAISESDSMRQALLGLLRAPKTGMTAAFLAASADSGRAAPSATAAAATVTTAGPAAVAAGSRSGVAPCPHPSLGSDGGGSGRAGLASVVAPPPPPRPPGAPPVTKAWESDESRKIVVKEAPSSRVSFALNARGENSSFNSSNCGLGGDSGIGIPRAAMSPGDAASLCSTSGRLSASGNSGRLSSGGSADATAATNGGGSSSNRFKPPGGAGGPVAESHLLISSGVCGNDTAALVSPRAGGGEDAADAAGGRGVRLSLQTLDVRPVLAAAVRAGKAYNVETAVESIVAWVDTNTGEGVAVFLAGISADLIQEMAMRFPSACANLLNLVSKDVMDQLNTLQVSATVLYGRDHLVKSSHVRNHFTWREQELRKLMAHNKGYSEHVIDALVDYGIPFECVYKAAVEMGAGSTDMATPEQFAVLIEEGFTGPELKQLISNGIRLAKVIGYIQQCDKPPPEGVGPEFARQLEVPMATLLRDMLRERLSPRIVDVILREEKMFETTKYNNFRPGRPLRSIYPEMLFVPKYTHHFVQMLLICWQRGDAKGPNNKVVGRWAKEFIDTVFEPNDPLCTKLKSAYDNKLTDTQVYIQGDSDTIGDAPPLDRKVSAEQQPQQQVQLQQQQSQQLGQREEADENCVKARNIRQLLRIFIGNYLLVHRWPVFLAAHLWLFVHGIVLSYWQRLEVVYYREKAQRFGLQMSLAKKARSGTIDAAVLAFPILGLIKIDGGDILTALVHADAPSAWFSFAIVRALYTLHWTNFGRVMVYLAAAVQLQFAGVFLAFFLLVLNHSPSAPSSSSLLDGEGDLGGDEATGLEGLSRLPAVQGLLAACMVLSASMLVERVQEARVPQQGTWVSVGRHLELACHAMVWTVASIVWSDRQLNLVPALSGLTMLLFVARLTFVGLVTEKLSTAVLALLEILSDSRYFFLLIALVYGGFVLAAAGLRQPADHNTALYTTQLFTVLLGDFQSTQLTDDRGVWRFPEFSLVLLSFYAVLMLIVFMNLLIATMNDTYDRVKEFREVEVMRLRSHMMVFVKDFIQHTAKKSLEHLDGDVLHLLLRPEEVKSGRWLAQSASEPSESAWAGRITYMRSSIVREVEAVVASSAEKTIEHLAAMEQRLGKVEAAASAASGIAAAAVAAATTEAAATPAAEERQQRLEALEQRLEGLQRGLDALARGGGGISR